MNAQPAVTSEMLSNHLGLAVERYPLPANVAGFLDYVEPPKFLAVNCQLSLAEQEITTTHELGHLLLYRDFLRNHPVLRWINRERTHPLAQKLSALYMEQFNEAFDAEFIADLCSVSMLQVMHRTDLVRLLVQRKPAMAPWAVLMSVFCFFRMIKRRFIPAMLHYFLFRMWI